MKSQRKTGVLLSYFNFTVSILGNLLLTPALIACLGDVQYSLYQVMRSLGGTLLLFNLGVSSIVARSIARSQALNDPREKHNALAIGMILSVVLAAIVGAASLLFRSCIPLLYHARFNASMLHTAQQVFGLFAAASICHILTDTFSGCLLGHEHFAANALVVTFKYALRFGLLFGYIRTGAGLPAIARVDLIVAASALVCLAVYALLVLHERPMLTGVSKADLRHMFVFSFAVLLQAAVNQLNTHMDPILLDWLVTDASVITMYSSALMIYSLYHQLVSMIGGYYLARASVLVARSASGSEMTDMLIKPGRFQAMLALGVIAGFALFGRRFIGLWIGNGYMDAYGVVLLLMIPALIPLVQSAALSILDAQFRRMMRSAMLLLATAVNVLLSLLLIRRFGPWGAATGTAVSVLLGHGWLMNRYYARTLGLEIGRLFREIFVPVLPPALLTMLLCLPLLFLPCTWLAFVFQCSSFLLLYAALLWRCSRNFQNERMTSDGI